MAIYRVPFHHSPQRRIIVAALDRIVHAEESGDIYAFPDTWAQARREGIEIEQEQNARR